MKVMMIMILALFTTSSFAHAGILWTWVNAGTGTEQGTFITDGNLVGDNASPGTYTVLDFSVTASDYGLVIGTYSGGDYILLMPEVGFDWDGTECTLFWRDSSNWTNGFSFFVTDPAPSAPNEVVFSVDYFMIGLEPVEVFLQEDMTPVITPEMTITENDKNSFGAVKMLYR